MAAVLALPVQIEIPFKDVKHRSQRPQGLCTWLQDTSAHLVRITVFVKQSPVPVDKFGLHQKAANVA